MEKDNIALLKQAGLRITKPRLAVLDALAANPHADAETVATTARTQLGSLSTQAVYDILHALTEHGLARRIEPAGHPTRYERRVGDNHHHAVCRSCGFTVDVECAAGFRPCLEAQNPNDFTIDEAEVIYWGLCKNCSNTSPSLS